MNEGFGKVVRKSVPVFPVGVAFAENAVDVSIRRLDAFSSQILLLVEENITQFVLLIIAIVGTFASFWIVIDCLNPVLQSTFTSPTLISILYLSLTAVKGGNPPK